MFWKLVSNVIMVSLAFACPSNAQNSTSFTRASFPPSFLLGAGSSAYQYEGATFIDGRKACIWDTFVQKHPEKIRDGSTADVVVDQYHRYKEDVALLKDLGFNVYRLSISWTRVLPNGTLNGGVNEAGVTYYNNLINELLANGITPVVTLFHWDLPTTLEEQYEGFLSRKIVDDFRNYADLCFSKFGDRVKIWLTLNEPFAYVEEGYQFGIFAPARCSDRSKCEVGDSSTEPYIVGHNLILAHAAAAHLYREKYQKAQKGQIGIPLNSMWMEPYSNSSRDKYAADRALDFSYGWFMNPLTYGMYPKAMVDNVGNRLPKFTPEESNWIKGSYDFIGINYYTSRYVVDVPCTPGNDACTMVTGERNGVPIGPHEGDSWVYDCPDGLLSLLVYTKEKYNDPIIYITENGVGDPEGSEGQTFINDTSRIHYYYGHLDRLHKAIWQGVKVRGFMAWSFLDNWEWTSGKKARAGLVHIDYPNGIKRIPKQSAIWFKNFINPKNPST